MMLVTTTIIATTFSSTSIRSELSILKMCIRDSIRELFQAHARMHAFYDLTKYCKTLSEGEPGEETDPEMRFDTEISKVVSEIDERIRFLKGKGLFLSLIHILHAFTAIGREKGRMDVDDFVRPGCGDKRGH